MKKTKTITLALLGAAFLANQSSAQNTVQRTIPSTFDKENNDSIIQIDTTHRSQRHVSSARRSSNGTRINPSRTTIVFPRSTSTKTKTRTYTVKPSTVKPTSTTSYSKSSSSSSSNTVTRGGFGRSGSSMSASS
jgi:hypothetical protein